MSVGAMTVWNPCGGGWGLMMTSGGGGGCSGGGGGSGGLRKMAVVSIRISLSCSAAPLEAGTAAKTRRRWNTPDTMVCPVDLNPFFFDSMRLSNMQYPHDGSRLGRI